MSETKNLLESFKRNLNEGSEFIRVFPEDSMEYKRLKDFCTTLNKNSKRTAYSVEETYFDYGQNWKWTTIIAHTKEERGGGYQALTPADQEKVITNTNVDEVLEHVLDYDTKLGESSLEKVRKDSIEKGLLTEDYTPSDIQLFMNTWSNYNNYGADVESINGGWMDLEQAKEFLEVHKEEEPFINDVDGDTPFKIDEYSNPWDVIEKLERFEELSPEDRDAFTAIMEDQNDDFDVCMDILESGDYIFFPGVETDEELGEAWVDMVGGLEGVSNPEYYIDEDAYKESWRETAEEDVRDENPDIDENSSEFEDLVEEWLNAVALEELQNELASGNDLSDYFDYEALGRDLDFDGFYFATTGAIQVL